MKKKKKYEFYWHSYWGEQSLNDWYIHFFDIGKEDWVNRHDYYITIFNFEIGISHYHKPVY